MTGGPARLAVHGDPHRKSPHSARRWRARPDCPDPGCRHCRRHHDKAPAHGAQYKLRAPRWTPAPCRFPRPVWTEVSPPSAADTAGLWPLSSDVRSTAVRLASRQR